MSTNACHSWPEPDNPSLPAIVQSSVFDAVDVMFNQYSIETHSRINSSPPTDSSSYMQLQRAPVDRRPVITVACQTCRERHLKCNGLTPCSRCTLDARECTYVKARRGRRGNKTQLRRVPADRPPTSVASSLMETSGTILSPESCLALPAHETALNHTEMRAQQWRDSLGVFYTASTSTTNSPPALPNLSPLQPDPVCTSVCIDVYFRFFHHTHPILLPRREFEERLSKGFVPYHLECAIKFNSSFFVSSIATRSYGDTLADLFNEHTPGNAYTVQAMLLLAIGMHANSVLEESIKFIRIASDLAIKLGMHRKEFATDHGEGIPVLEESWRRTWWELYAIDGMLAGVCPVHHFDLYNIESDVPLPCEESEYNSGVC
jgi:hypothetical protein